MSLWAKYRGLAQLILLVIVAPLVVWQYALSSTITHWNTTNNNRKEIAKLRVAAPQKSAKTTLVREMILSGEVVAELLTTIEQNGLQLAHFSPIVTSEKDGVRLATGSLTIEGDFIGMVRFLDVAERQLTDCKLIAAQFRVKKEVLSCTVHLQQITLTP